LGAGQFTELTAATLAADGSHGVCGSNHGSVRRKMREQLADPTRLFILDINMSD
jgi:hypothetical protein